MTTKPPPLHELPVEKLVGVGPIMVTKLAKIGLHNVQDILFHLPLRYQDRTRVTPIGSLRHGQDAVVTGSIELVSVNFGRRRSLRVTVSDATGFLTLRLFYFNQLQQQGFENKKWITCYGEARRGANGLEMIHPEYRLSELEPTTALETSLTPIYPTTEGLNQRTLFKLSDTALTMSDSHLQDYLPQDIANALGYTDLRGALNLVHRPPPDSNVAQIMAGEHPAQQRLAFEELLAHALALRRAKHRRQTVQAPSFSKSGSLWKKLHDGLPFTLTNAQQRVIEELKTDLAKSVPAQRLVQGDVGSGKTVVAAAAACDAIEAGYQVAFMAPTELLSEQHVNNLAGWFEPLDVRLVLLSGALKAAAKRNALAAIGSGEAQLVMGTHALFQDAVEFNKLGLVIVDEQHRFGVQQRLVLKDKGNTDGNTDDLNQATSVHQITMTATPIPRSLAMAVYADMDVSSIDELPPGRKPVDTAVVVDQRRDEVQQRVRKACADGRQAYWVCPLIDESDVLQAQAATETTVSLKAAFPELKIALLHGRMKSVEKDVVMNMFRSGDIDLLVATTVIEVGVDVPNASLMIIENAERLGLAQLHQLRGRVGRGEQKSVCVLMYQAPLSRAAKQRLSVMRRTNDGFEIAQCDLEQRGPGEIMGTRQTGLQKMRIADLIRDKKLLPRVEQAAGVIQQKWPDNVEPLIQRWVHEGERYSDV